MAIPKLDGPYCTARADGGVRITLLGHYLYINQTGAFGVVPHDTPFKAVFNKPSVTGAPFHVAPEW